MRAKGICVGLAVGTVTAATAWALAGNSVAISVGANAGVGQRYWVRFSGSDSSPPNARGTYVGAVLEPPLKKGGSRCKRDLGSTEQNHPASRQLYFQKLLDTGHTGHYSVEKRMPRFTTTGTWRVCAWQFNNDGRTNTDAPASHAEAFVTVRSKG
jgi:hypothetical protein